MGVGNRSTRRKPLTCRQSLTNFSVTNNLMENTAAIRDIMFNILTFDTNGQHSTWLYDKRDDCSFTITHFPQNSIISIALPMEFNLHTSTATLKQLIYIPVSTSPYETIRSRMVKQNRLILSFKNLCIV